MSQSSNTMPSLGRNNPTIPPRNADSTPATNAPVCPVPAPSMAAATTAQEAQDDEETFEPDPTATPGPTALMAGAFQHFYKDQSKLSPAKKIGCIILMMADQHNYGLTVMHKRNVEEAISSGENPSSINPPTLITPQTFAAYEVFEKLMSMKGYYSKIILPKTDIMAELLRRVPNIQDDK
jgi:hypothetical protein